MSLRDKASAVRAKGEAERGDFTPKGAPLNIYKYWARHSRHVSDRENFCHFWRVVAIWAPFMALRRGVANTINAVYDSLVALVILAAVLVAALVYLAVQYNDFAKFLAVVGLTLIAVVAATLFIAGTVWVCERPRVSAVFKRAGKAIGRFFNKHGMKVFITFTTLVVTAVLVDIGISTHWWVPLLGVGFALLGSGLGIGAAVLLEATLLARRAEAKKAADDYRWEYFEAHGEFPPAPVRVPGRISRFFTALGDLLVFAFQVVRVNKWKICPTVDIEN